MPSFETSRGPRRALTGAPGLRFDFDKKRSRNALLAWYRANNRSLPWRELWAKHRDPYHVWVSEIMLQQTVIKAMIPVYERFLTAFPDLRALALGSEAAVREAVRGLGYYRRFGMLHAASKQLVGRSGAGPIAWPLTYDGWKELPGIGDYTAAAVSSIAFDFPAAVVDGNVERVFCRLLDIREAPNQPHLKRAFKGLATDLLDVKHAGDFNQALMELGQLLCTPTQPQCAACPINFSCLAYDRASQALAPAPKTKPEFKDVAMRLTIVRDESGRVALFDRPQTARFLRGTQGFLTALANDDGHFVNDGRGSTLPTGIRTAHAATVKHGITNHRIKVDVRLATLSTQTLPGATWLDTNEVERKLVSNLDRKAWHAVWGQARSATD